ncbi:MAG: PIN domain-containing protein [Anaerolineae bacterium]|nr:PIN domain-containing protein [Anaerolineae bacterium]
MIVLDTDHCVAFLRGRLDITLKASPDVSLAIAATTVGELIHGAHKSAQPERNLRQIAQLLTLFDVLPFDAAAARYFGQHKALLERRGQRLSDLDLQVAAIALANDASLATHNQAHFRHIPDLRLEDWLA